MGWSTTGASVDTSKAASSTILFAKSGATVIRQIETVTVVEKRGMTKANAQALATVTDTTTQTAYYATIDGESHSINVMSGSKTERTASRSNEAEGWTVVEKTTIYSTVPDIDNQAFSDVWKTSRTATSASGMEVSYDKSIATCMAKSDCTLYSVKTTTVTEYRNLTLSAATTLVDINTTSSVVQKTMHLKIRLIEGRESWYNSAWYVIQKGTEKRASSRQVSATEGYTVTMTETVYSWSQSGNTTDKMWVEP